MSLALSFCPGLVAAPAQPSGTLAPGSKGLALLGASAALAVALAVVTAGPLAAPIVPVASYAAGTLVADRGTSPAALLHTAEAVRARLLSIPGVGAVGLRGLQPGGIEVDYAPARLARFGVTPADLRAALPVQEDRSAPGRLAVRQDAAGAGPQPIADRPVQAGSHVFRLGDIATVARTQLASPAATLQRDGALAVEMWVVPATGADGSLERRVAAGLAQAALPGDVRLR